MKTGYDASSYTVNNAYSKASGEVSFKGPALGVSYAHALPQIAAPVLTKVEAPEVTFAPVLAKVQAPGLVKVEAPALAYATPEVHLKKVAIKEDGYYVSMSVNLAFFCFYYCLKSSKKIIQSLSTQQNMCIFMKMENRLLIKISGITNQKLC